MIIFRAMPAAIRLTATTVTTGFAATPDKTLLMAATVLDLGTTYNYCADTTDGPVENFRNPINCAV